MVKQFVITSVLVILFAGVRLGAQGETTSAISGQVTDATSAAVSGATVTIVSTENGLKRSVRTDDSGRFNFPQLRPGTYTVKVEAAGFDSQQIDSLASGLGQNQIANFKLTVEASKQSVIVTGEAPLINPANANTSTTMTAHALEDLPNPGGDMTYPLQFAAGALINTAGSSNDFQGSSNGYGNVGFNGLPAVSNGYIVDGLETNDPLTNLNSGLSTNLVLGMNSIAEVTVNTVSYAVDQGRYGASQVNYVTKSGGNQFHGNLYELWNGSRFNAADFFTNATEGNHKPRSTVNHFGGSLGGPVVKDKLFFFADAEWFRIALPIVTTATVPTPAFQNYVLAQLPLGGKDSVNGSVYGANAQSVPFYRNLFSLYQDTSGSPLAILGCPFNTDGSAAVGAPPNGNGCANRRSVSLSNGDHEQVQTGRIDYNLDQKNTLWFRFQADTGLQAAWTDPINPIFNAISPQPLYSFASGFTHIVSPTLINYFNPAFSWYSSLFGNLDPAKTLAAFPIVLQGSGSNAPFTTLGELDNTWPQGRRAARFHLNDNLVWSVRGHEFRLGVNTRILRLNDYDFGEGTTPLVTWTTLPQFIYGVAATASKSFPLSDSQPFNILNLDFYAQDTWKITPKLTWTYGLRDTYNSNPLNPHNTIARLPGSFGSISHDVNQPLDDAIHTGLSNVFAATPVAILQPRTAVAYQITPSTVLRTGFGTFSDILPGSVADTIGYNPPYVKNFQGGLLGTVGGTSIAPGVDGSAVGATVAANQSFSSGFAGGQLSCASLLSNPATCIPPVSITAVPDGKLHAPYFMQWSFGLEHQFGLNGSLRVQYVGTRAVNQAYQTQVNGYQTVCQGCFAPFPYLQPADPRFGAVTQLNTGANSHYNGLQITALQRFHGLLVQGNYAWSRCMDTVSNGGFLPFSSTGIIAPLPEDLARQYGPCDYDVRQNLTGTYVYELPKFTSSRVLGWVANGWQVSGTLFFHTGLPFSVVSTPYSADGDGIVNGSGPQFASLVSGVPVYDHQSIPGVTQPGTIQWLNPNAFVSTVDPSTGACAGGNSTQSCQFGDLGRNSLRGPDFVWSDFYITKRFVISERVKLRIEGQFFNIFNHPNFALPSVLNAGIPGKPSTQTGFGTISGATSPPTGLLGVGLGGDSTPRMVAFQARLEF